MAVKNAPSTPEEYIAQLDEPRRSQIQELYDLIRKAAPKLEPWVVQNKIGFGKFSYQGRTKSCAGEWFKVAIGSNKNTIMVATCAIVDGKNLAEVYGKKLPKADIGKSCINFRKFEDIDLDVVREIAKKSAAADYSNWMM